MKIKILSDAENDLIEGYYFYEDRQTDLGHRFLEHLDSEILHLSSVCGVHKKQFGYYRAVVRKNFPYAVYYKVENKIIYIHAIFDCRKNLKNVESSLKSR